MIDLEITIHELLRERLTTGAFMSSLIDVHERAHPTGDWSPFRLIEYDREVARLKWVWLARVLDSQPPARVPVAGLWFGLFSSSQVTVRGEYSLADFYVSGTKEFVLNGNADWASVPIYVPEDDCAGSEVLTNIYRLATRGGASLGPNAEEFLGVGYVASAIAEVLRECDGSLIAGSSEPVGVAVGWNSGDPLYLGFVDRAGFSLYPREQVLAGIKSRREHFARKFEQ